jgi:hypothetical protein
VAQPPSPQFPSTFDEIFAVWPDPFSEGVWSRRFGQRLSAINGQIAGRDHEQPWSADPSMFPGRKD